MVNLIVNPDFEVNTTGWSPVGALAQFTRDTAQFHGGVASGLMAPDDISQGVQTTAAINFTVGKTYLFTAWIRNGGTVRMNIGATQLQQSAPPANTWFQYSAQWVATVTSAQLSFITLTGQSFNLDDVFADEVITTPQSKRDTLLAGLPGIGSVSDRLYEQQKAAYAGADPTAPLTLNDYLVANGVNKNIIQ